MQQLRLSDLYSRGLNGFNSLSSLERDVFVIHDADLYFEMEGSLEHYLSASSHANQLTWLQSVLQRIGDLKSSEVLAKLVAASAGEADRIEHLSSRYHQLSQQRWVILDCHLKQHNAQVVL
jgi:hypothetical protein